MTEVIMDWGIALVHPVTLGYVCNPVPVELHVSSPLSVLHRASYPAVPVSGHPRAMSKGNTILAGSVNWRSCASTSSEHSRLAGGTLPGNWGSLCAMWRCYPNWAGAKPNFAQ